MSRVYDAASKGNEDELRKYLGEKPNKVNYLEWGKTPLYAAAQYGHFRCVRYLLSMKANVNFKSSDHCTALMAGVSSGKISIVRALLRAGAKVNQVDVLSMCKNNEILKLLLDSGARKGINDALLNALVGGDELKFQMLLDAGADVKSISNANSALIDAVQDSNYRLVKQLLDYGVNVNYRTDKDDTPIILAVEADNKEMADLLLEHGATLDEDTIDFAQNKEMRDFLTTKKTESLNKIKPVRRKKRN